MTQNESNAQEGWKPQPRQELFLQSMADEALYGGAKGGGKTDALLAEACRQLDHPIYEAAIFRREYPRLEEIIKRSHAWFKNSGTWREDKKRWTFPSGARINFFHCENEKDKYNHQGKQYQFIGWDQIEEFTESIYDFVNAACRTTAPGLRCYIRATANPGNIGHAWVKKRFISPLKHNGEMRWFRRIDDEYVEVPKGTPHARSRAFVFANVYDNQILMRINPGYLSNLENLPTAYRNAFLLGDWDAFEGQFFSEFSRKVHVLGYHEYKAMCEVLPHFRFAAGDYGFTNPSAIGWFCEFPEGMTIQYRELYKRGLSYEELMHEILNLTPQEEDLGYLVMDPAIQGDKQHHVEEKDGLAKGESGLDKMEKICNGRFPILLGDNRRKIGWVNMHSKLQVFKNQHGVETAKLRYTENCIETIRTIPTLVHSQRDPEDLDSDGEDHPADMNRYGIQSRIQTPVSSKPPETAAQRFWARVEKDNKKNESEDISDGDDVSDDGEDL